jgi:hypothetical protein
MPLLHLEVATASEYTGIGAIPWRIGREPSCLKRVVVQSEKQK